MTIFLLILVSLMAIKHVFIGSDFSFIRYFKYGKVYSEWYRNREDFGRYYERICNEVYSEWYRNREDFGRYYERICNKDTGDGG